MCLRVTHVSSDSNAEAVGIRAGVQIVAAGNVALKDGHTISELMSQLRSQSDLELSWR